MKNNRLYPLLVLLLLMRIPTMQNNLKNTLGKKGIPFWGKKVYLFGVKTYTFFGEENICFYNQVKPLKIRTLWQRQNGAAGSTPPQPINQAATASTLRQ